MRPRAHHLRPARSARRARGGFTLLELLVVAMLGTILITMTTNVWRWYARTINAMEVGAQLDKELKMAAQAIAQDYGPALSVRSTDGSDVEFDYDSDNSGSAQWAAPDTVVEYVISGGKLIRRDVNSSVEIPMARLITGMTTELVAGQLNVHLTASYRGTEQDLTLQLRDPS